MHIPITGGLYNAKRVEFLFGCQAGIVEWDDTQAKRRESSSTAATNLDFQNGDVRAAVFGLLKNDEDNHRCRQPGHC